MIETVWQTKALVGFGSKLVVPIINNKFQCSRDNEVRYLDLMYLPELRHSKMAVMRFLVAVEKIQAFPRRM
jgi:hypothetical protein